ncbi:protein SSUH2 homolog isoform X1 [Lepisosteus oculatus]|uniref:Protein SSUH2 homolog n=1 Tax=Lepisosteus oculatus TaxID=7918 RepID=W5N7M4_LEPOC|nr:PREDICTED: protein SSUH2 homolog isoform X1 [Lepisosteus oculatus]
MDGKDEEIGECDPDIPEEGPTAPPVGLLDDVSGYEETPKDGDSTDKMYPPPADRMPIPENDRSAAVPQVRVPIVSEDIAREALLQFVDKKWTYRSKPARELVFKDLKPFTIYRYRLETYTESRASAWEFEPYTDQFVDGPQYGMSPPPWDVAVEVPPTYTDATQKVRVPHSSFVKECHRCYGRGRIRCSHCHGRGRTRCIHCHGTIRSQNKRCTFCHGRGHNRCSFCHGRGHKICPSCHGHKTLMHFIQLTVTWKNHVFEHVPDRIPEFPVKKFEKVTGDAFFVDESILVYPIVGFPDEEICEASKRGIQEHLMKFSSINRILQQRQTIELLPLTHAFYDYKGQEYTYFVFGIENQVYAPKYPTSCCIL